MSCGTNILRSKCVAKQCEIKGKWGKLGVLKEFWKGKTTCLCGIRSQNEFYVVVDHLKKILLALE